MRKVEVSDREFEVMVPLVVIGAGAAGMVAALSAKAEGVDVLVLERDPLPRGSTALSAGLIPAAGTRWQRAIGVEDTPEAFGADILHKADDEPDVDLVRLVTETVGPTLEWLAEEHGLAFSLVDNFRYPGHSHLRMHGLPSRSGEELIDRLRDAAEEAGIDILTEAHVDTLVVGSDGKPRGMTLSRPDGSREDIGCEALILACNGYGGNPALVADHIPEMRDALYFGHPGNQGDAIVWGEALGAATRHLSGHQGHGSVAHPAGILITWATVMEGGFQVNVEGKRFSNEAKGYSEQASNVLAQPEGIAWTVFDTRIAAIAGQFEDFRSAERMHAIIEADTIEALAERMQVSPEKLTASFRAFENCKAEGGADPFGRSLADVPPLRAPFKAVRVTGALFHTQGGLVVDGEARVVRRDGSTIANLFAAGGAACGVSGSKASGYLSGNGLLTAVALGRISGLRAAAYLRNC
ncbi:FAD-dependent oxidoreductase [Neorhizobium sp. DAR64860/K0K1]|uniref:FAD-dependent oxidoreductase n=1 Tax=Neorhizobium sp. DAR64860/K0K1 TaxID=3421955 RepID=UPI003D2E54D6